MRTNISAWPVEISRAKGLLLALGGFPPFVREFGDADGYLLELTRNESEVGAYVQLATAVDYDRWLASYGSSTSQSERVERAAVKKLQVAAESAEVHESLNEVAARGTAQHVDERKTHLKILRHRRRSEASK